MDTSVRIAAQAPWPVVLHQGSGFNPMHAVAEFNAVIDTPVALPRGGETRSGA